jgi:hypothetical protein
MASLYGASRSYSDTPHFVGLFWTSDQPETETSNWQHQTSTREINSCPRGDSNPNSQRPQTHALDRAACDRQKVELLIYNFNLLSYAALNPLTPNDLKRRRAVSPLKIKIPCKKISAGSVARRDLIPALKCNVMRIMATKFLWNILWSGKVLAQWGRDAHKCPRR